MTNLIAAVALATNTKSNSEGSAPKNVRSLSRTSSIRDDDNWDDGESECGFPSRFVVMSRENLSMSDLE